ncbi:hypothetical protein DB354_04145 [Opitutus sp. ER46]|nr:hypothetical protein DB354_04145 [Opitutus sp. ER46]
MTINAPPSVAATLSISPQSTNAPGSATVTWSSEHATAVALSGPNGFQSALPQGSQTVTNLAAGTHSFTLTAQGYGGPITKSVTVTVVEPAQLTAWLTVDPTTATEPAAARLTWGSTNATSVLVTGPASQLSTATSGDHALTALAAGTHTFNLRAEGPGGPLTRSATIVVQPRPASVTATLAASPVFLAAPGNTTLTWSSANASAVAVTGPNFAGSTSPNGTQAITALPVGDHTFTLVAQGQDGPVTRSTLVHVAPAPSGPPVSASIEANPSTGTPPGTTTVTWTSLNATSVIVTGAGLADTTEPNGSRVVKDLPEGLHHFTITAQGVGGPVSRTADFYVSKPLPYVTAALAAEVSVATAPGVAALTWSTENATSVVVSGPGLDPRGEPTGTQTLNGLAAGSHTYTLTAQGFGGPVTRTATVVIGEGSTTGPVTATISTNPDAGGAPGTTTVTWASANATRVSVTGPGLPEKNSPSGSHTVSGLDYGSHVYTITAQGEGGPAVARANFSVISGLSRTLTVVPENTPVPWGGDTVTFTGYSSRAGPGFLNLWRRVFERRLVPTWTIVDSTEDQEAIWGWKDVMTTVELPRVFVTTFTFTMGVGPGQRWGTWNAPDNFSSEPVEYMVETWGQDIYGGHGVALFKQDPAPPPQAQNVVLTPTFATAAPGATVILTAAGGHTSYHWTGLNADTSNQVRFVVPANAVGGSTYPVSVYSPAGRLWSTYWAQSNTVTATIQVVVPRQVTSLTPLASSITVSDPSSPLHGRTYPRMWQDGNWTAYLGRPGVKFAVKANASPSVAAIELQAKPPGGEWTRLALQSPATAAATVDLTFDVMLGETAPGQPLVPLSFQQGAPLTGPWAFRARVQDAAQVWSDPCPEISVNVILPVVTKTLSGQTVPPAGELGQWFTASPLKEFTIPLWIP